MLDATFVNVRIVCRNFSSHRNPQRFGTKDQPWRGFCVKLEARQKVPLSPFLFASLFGVESSNLSLVKEIVSYIIYYYMLIIANQLFIIPFFQILDVLKVDRVCHAKLPRRRNPCVKDVEQTHPPYF